MQSDTVTLNGSRYHAKGLRSSTCIPRSRWNWVYSMLWYVMYVQLKMRQRHQEGDNIRQCLQTSVTLKQPLLLLRLAKCWQILTGHRPSRPSPKRSKPKRPQPSMFFHGSGTSPRHQPWRTLRMPNFKGHCWRYLVVHDLSTSKLCTSWILLLMSQSSLHCGWWLGHRAVIRSKMRLSVFHDSEFHLVEVFATIEINFPFLWCTPFISSSNILTIASDVLADHRQVGATTV